MRIEIKCDNLAVVQVLHDGKAKDPLLATIARNIWMLTSLFNIQFSVSHIAGQDNAIADLLSRWWVTDNRSKNCKNYYLHISGYLHILILSSLITVFSTCLLINPCVCLGDHSFAARLTTRAFSRLLSVFRPATQKEYVRMFGEFLAFLVVARLLINRVTTVTLLIMEFLVDQGLSPSNIVNHMVAIRSQFIFYSLDTSPFRDERIHLFQKVYKTFLSKSQSDYNY